MIQSERALWYNAAFKWSWRTKSYQKTDYESWRCAYVVLIAASGANGGYCQSYPQNRLYTTTFYTHVTIHV